MSKITMAQQVSDPDTPSAGNVTLYAKGGQWYSRDDQGAVLELGANYAYEADAENTAYAGSTDNETWTEHLKLTTAALSPGRYRIDWWALYSHNATQNFIQMRVQVDDATDLVNPDATDGNEKKMSIEPADAAGSGNGATDQRLPMCGFAYVTLTSGTHTIDFDFKPEWSDESSIHHSRLSIRRVS